jgi:hypothetical protein
MSVDVVINSQRVKLRILETKPQPHVFDFAKIDEDRVPMAKPAVIGRNGRALSLVPRKMRDRVRAQTRKGHKNRVAKEFKQLYKPIEEWDEEELARGRPRNRYGNFQGKSPTWISRELHEEAMTRFRQAMRDQLNSSANKAVTVINRILDDDTVDHRGRPNTPPSTKLDASKFLVEHVIGKPKQRVETELSVKMQGMLATAIITPGTLPAAIGAAEVTSPRSPADLGIIDAESWEDED